MTVLRRVRRGGGIGRARPGAGRGRWPERSGGVRPSAARSEAIRSCRRGPATGRGCRRPLPTWRGRPRPGASRTYWAALTLRSSSAALRPMPSAVISMNWMTPSGSITKVPRSARPWPSTQHVEVAADRAGRVADHRVLDLADGVGGVVPRLVGEVGVGRHRVDLDAELLELGVVVGQVAELGRADEGEVGRVEEHDRPLALEVGVADVDELAVVEGGGA